VCANLLINSLRTFYPFLTRALVGDPISSEQAHHERLNKKTALLLKGKLLFARNIVVTSVPHHLRR